MYRIALTILLLLACLPAAAQTNWELRVLATADLQDIHAAYTEGRFSREQLQNFVDAEYQRMQRYCPNGLGSCDTPERERRNLRLLDLYVVAYAQ